MGLRDCNGRSSPYVRQENDDIGIAPSEVMADVPRSYNDNDCDSDDELQLPANIRQKVKVKTSRLPNSHTQRKSMSRRAKSPPPPPRSATGDIAGASSRKRKATESLAASEPSSSSRARSHKSTNVTISTGNKHGNLKSLAELDDDSDEDDDDDLITLVGSSPEKDKSPSRRVRPPHSGGSSPLKPRSAFTFMGYHCQMPECAFSASSPQHIRHHYETFQHGRVTRQFTMMRDS
jgi:hypothetical protein